MTEPPPRVHPGRQGLWGRVSSFTPSFLALVFLYLLFAGLLISRRPDCISNPQFWAEDGTRFFTEALNRSVWVNLASFSYGYFDLMLRLTHQFAAIFPIENIPFVLVLLALAVQAAVPTFIVSTRCETWMGAFPIRLFAALLYCGMPNSFETHCIPLHARVHLAILAALILVSRPALSFAGRIFDAATLILSGFSGPFVMLLAPVALWRYLEKRSAAEKRNCAILLLAFVLQLVALINSTAQRFGPELGASVLAGIRILGGQFTVSFFLGEKTYAILLPQPWFDAAAVIGFIILLALLIALAWRGTTEVRSLLLVGFGTLALALTAPIVTGDRPQWLALWSIPGCGQRYYFPAMAMLLFALAAAVGRGQRFYIRGFCLVLLLWMATMAVRVDWILPAFTNFDFPRYAKEYQALPPGGSMSIPINPPGWPQIQLRKENR